MTPPSTRLNSRMTWLLAVVLAAAVLLSTSFYSFRSFSRSTELVRRTAAVQVELERLLSALLNAETGERGFLLTGQEEFLEPYHLGITDAQSRLARLRELISDEDERRALDGLDALTGQWFALLGELVSLRRRGQNDAALDVVRSLAGKQTLDRIRARVRHIVEAEEGELERRQREADEGDRVTVLLVSSSGAALALALAVGAVVRKTAEQRRRSDAEREEDYASALDEEGRSALARALAAARRMGQLFVEDDPDDAHLTQRALRKAGVSHRIVHLTDGEAALHHLFPQAGEPPELPAVVFLDLKLPKVDGAEVLRRIRTTERTRRLPVVILTSSKERRDLDRCYDAGANSYVCKPIDVLGFQEAVRSLGLYWLLVNEGPPA